MYNRLFKLWYYTVSHRQALLRSIGYDNNENIDVYFGDVSYIEIPTVINGIEIVKPTLEDEAYIMGKIGEIKKVITVLKVDNKRYYIVSSTVKIMQNNLSIFDLPFDIINDMGGIYNKNKK